MRVKHWFQATWFAGALITAMLVAMSMPAFAELKVAVADLPRALLNSDVGQAGVTEIQDEFESDQETLKEAQKDLTALYEKLKKDTEFMSDQEFDDLLGQIQAKNSELISRGQSLQRALEERRQQLIQRLNPIAREAIDQLVLDEDYDIIFPSAIVHFSGELYDVTLDITEKINEIQKDKRDKKDKNDDE